VQIVDDEDSTTTSDEHAFERSTPRARDDLLVRHYDNEAVAWSPTSSEPVHLGPFAALMLQLLDGDVSLGELIADVCAVLDLEEGGARDLLRDEMSHLESAGMLTTSEPTANDDCDDDVFPAPPNP
jgi:hypothetical protein